MNTTFATMPRMNFGREPYMLLTNIAYAVAAGVVWQSPLFAISLFLLSIGSGLYHYGRGFDLNIITRYRYRDYDFYAMYLVFSVLISEMTSLVLLPFLMIGSILIYERFNYGRVRLGLVGVFWFASWMLTGFDLILGGAFGLSLLVRQLGHHRKHEDILHGLWHIMTAVSFTLYLSHL